MSKMHILLLKYLLVAFGVSSWGALSAAPQSLELTKGHVVDLLFLTQKENISELRSQYFKDIYPPAKALGYTPVTGFRIKQKPISGYYSPNVMAIGTWPGDWEQRKAHFQNLKEARPEIRSRRLDIWSTFNMMNFEVKEGIKVSFDPTKSYVFGAYWLEKEQDSAQFLKSMLAVIRQAGGNVELVADEVKTMFGYTEAPALILLSRWQSQREFEQFNKSDNIATNSEVKRISEFFLHIKSE